MNLWMFTRVEKEPRGREEGQHIRPKTTVYGAAGMHLKPKTCRYSFNGFVGVSDVYLDSLVVALHRPQVCKVTGRSRPRRLLRRSNGL